MPSTPIFQPVIMIPEAERTDADNKAISMVYTIQNEIRSTMQTERNLQTTIGVSEFGMECQRCVARLLSGEHPKVRNPDEGWKAMVGTFGHAGLEDHFTRKYSQRNGRAEQADILEGVFELSPTGVPYLPASQVRAYATDDEPWFITERKVRVDTYKQLDLCGSCDLFIQGETFGIVDDWKFQGPKKLVTTATGKIGQQYTVQGNGYGKGFEDLGFLVTHFLLYALPRDGELPDAKPVLFRYNRQVALDALQNVHNMIDAAELIGWDSVIAAQQPASFCFDCRRYESHDDRSFIAAIQGKE
jgi:hypothetical protein